MNTGLVILTQNLCGGGPCWRIRRAMLLRQIARLAPDLIGLQEVHASDAAGKSSQAGELAERVPGYAVAFAPGHTASSGRCEGVALLSKYPVREFSFRRLSQDRDDPLDRFGPRLALRAVVDVPEGPVDVFVTHLSLSRRARARTVPELFEFIAGERPPSSESAAILMGDFNAGPGELRASPLGQGEWLDAWTSTRGARAGGGTYPAPLPFWRIDYVFIRTKGRWSVRRCSRQRFSGSDHRGVAAWLNAIT
jgi:endonuclease/exonuclease/phosphatase family metal-dependent hydrolase